MQDRTIESNKSHSRTLFMWLALVPASIIFIFNIVPKLINPTIIEQIKSNGQLIVLTRNSPTTYYEESDGPAGIEYEMAKMFANELDVDLVLVVPASFNDLLNQIRNNSAHIAAAGLTVTNDRKKFLFFGPAYQEITEQLVYNSANKRPKDISDLDGGTLEVVANSSHEETLRSLKHDYPHLTWKSNHELESEDLLQMVSDDIIEYTIADSNTLSLNQRFLINLRTAFDISEPLQLAWALPKSDDKSLLLEVQKFFRKITENGELARIIERNYGHVEKFDYVGTKIYRRHIQTRLPSYRVFFEEAANMYDLDWRLIAAMGYQESHWDPDAISPTGVRGIMMLTLKTANDLNIKNRTNPEQSINGGAQYFRQTKDRINETIPEPDRTLLAMAAYNVGYGHVQDARELTRKLDKDPDRWADVKEVLPLLAKRKWYKQTRYGYARGWEPVDYVENIRSYYDILKWVDESNITATPVPDEFLKIPNSL
ncbi:MAG: membrane-bound lytic murein transglycosylase MltF [Gammaproteobacteria bacterium]|nr:membrane-bound lytic murein transglycosylase MltF [Gammaproteobacteria bacterium]